MTDLTLRVLVVPTVLGEQLRVQVLRPRSERRPEFWDTCGRLQLSRPHSQRVRALLRLGAHAAGVRYHEVDGSRR
jgi:hypothetical protein